MKYLIFTIVFTFSLIQISAQDKWAQHEGIPGNNPARHHPVTFSLDGYGYVVAGQSNFAMDDFYRFDPNTGEWETLPDFPGPPRGFSYGATYEGRAFIGFGVSNTAYLNDLWSYSPETEGWIKLSDCPCAGRAHPAFVQAGGKIYIAAGNDNIQGDMDDFWAYDIETDEWEQLPDFPGTRRHHPYYFSVNDKVYVGFGHHQMQIFNDFYEFDPETGEWTQMNDFPGEGRVAGTQFSFKGKGYILSGQGEDHENLSYGEFYEWDPEKDEWTELPPHPGSGRWAPGSFIIGNTLYFTSGLSDDRLESDLWSYELDVDATVENSESEEMEIYPNPAAEYIILKNMELNNSGFSIADLSGRIILEGVLENNKIELGELPTGVYNLRIINGNGIIHKVFARK